MLKWPAAGQPVYSSSATKSHELGARGEDRYGRTYRYALAGGTSLVVGDALQSAAQLANHQDLTPAAAAVGDKTLVPALGATAATVDQYAGGMAVIDTTPGIGYSYPIRSHLAADASASVTLNLAPGWEVVVALTTSSRISLYANPYSGVIQTPVTTLTGAVVGVAQYIIVNAQYGWVGTNGMYGTLIDGTPAVGTPVGAPAAAAGAVGAVLGVDAAIPEMTVGSIMDTGQDGQVQAVLWAL